MDKDRSQHQTKKVKKDINKNKETPNFKKMRDNEQNYMLEYFCHHHIMMDLFEDYKLTLISEEEYKDELCNNFESVRLPVLFSIILLEKYKITLEGRNYWTDLKIKIDGVDFNDLKSRQILDIVQADTEFTIVNKYFTDGNQVFNTVFMNTLAELIKIRFGSEYSENITFTPPVSSARSKTITRVFNDFTKKN